MKQYFDPPASGSFSGVEALSRAAKKKRKQVKAFLENEDSYTLHKPIVRRFKRRPTLAPGPNVQVQADLIDVSNIKKHNNGYTFILTVIDVFSRLAFAVPLKNKSGATLTAAFQKILKKHPVKYLQTDKGTEFKNKQFQSMLKKNNVSFFTTQNDDIKASVVERFNKTLKNKMYRYFTHKNTYKYTNVLSAMVQSYNDSYHGTIKMAPNQVSSLNLGEVWHSIHSPEPVKRPAFKVGDHVRISKAKKTFEKGYLPNWSTEIFAVHSVKKTNPPVYQIRDYSDEVIEGFFYEQELQKVSVSQDRLYHIDQILKKRKRGGKTEYLVTWRGYPSSMTSWVSDLKKI
jgi:transposase InsO family protein